MSNRRSELKPTIREEGSVVRALCARESASRDDREDNDAGRDDSWL